MAELGTRVSLRMKARYLIKLVRQEFTDEITRTLRQNEQVILQLHELCDLLVLLEIRGLKRLLQSHRQEANILHNLLTHINDRFPLLKRQRRLSLFEVREPERNKGQAYDLWDERLDITVAVAGLLVNADVFILELDTLNLIFTVTCVEQNGGIVSCFFGLLFLMNLLLHLVDYLRDWRALNIHQIETSQIFSVCHLEHIDEVLARARLCHSQETAVLQVLNKAWSDHLWVVNTD